MSGKLVLVSGASGYIATHIVKQLLQVGYKVRGSVSSLKDPKKYEPLYGLHPQAKTNLELVEGQLGNADHWVKAVKGVDLICHVASPLPSWDGSSSEDNMVSSARDGTLNVLKAAEKEKSVKRIVVTSSVASVLTSGGNKYPADETNWTVPAEMPPSLMYNKSKVIAERAAWAFYESLPSKSRFELVTINPSYVLGPILYQSSPASVSLIKMVMEKALPCALPVSLPIVDVRDVAKAHVNALTNPEADGRRFVVFSNNITSKAINEVLKEEFESQGYDIATNELSLAEFEGMCGQNGVMNIIRDQFLQPMKLDNTKLREVLKINPIDVKKSILESAYSMVEHGAVNKTPKYKGPSKN